MSGDSVPPEYLAEVLSATWMQGSCRSQHRAQVGEDMMRHSASKGWWGSPLFCIQLICVHLNSPSPLALFLAHPGQSRHHITIIISLTHSLTHTTHKSTPCSSRAHTSAESLQRTAEIETATSNLLPHILHTSSLHCCSMPIALLTRGWPWSTVPVALQLSDSVHTTAGDTSLNTRPPAQKTNQQLGQPLDGLRSISATKCTADVVTLQGFLLTCATYL